ncbi:acyl-CoA dehydrogenase family protein [Bradyrhizobium sp. AUGA SZCCT0042]|uniref:acyl-CoA dehydrogenase family protein n=1 Tax=Bradyrhizobium sp. AUGA SZCCT0042 TaxID=2807651 RepID=UPI001BA57004|nr:acyl-CoA dehydrogenase family protein [Bradyrhizobium sp. AUGA SZCCT0042]MBR1301125.1 acyl-CoA/acyl-ACP dehydrogenase [Bradyrhizobium sp. AUGA SZCCT0042]
MNFTLSEEHEALRDMARNFLAKESSLSKLLVAGASVEQAGYEQLWPKIVELGWPGIVIPERFGGLGMTYIDLAMIAGEIGRALASAPLFGTLAGAWAVESAGDERQKAELLGAVATGKLKLALAVSNSDGAIGGQVSDATAVKQGDGYVLSGSRSFVVDAKAADKIVVMAKVGSDDKFFVVDAGSKGVVVDVLEWRDPTRQVCSVRFDGAKCALLHGSDAGTWGWIRNRLYLFLAAESAAGTERVLADAVTYAKDRVAFGRPIGGFQAIKHQLAEVAGISECATAGVHYAAWALTENDVRADLACAMAQSYASEAYRDATYRNIQVFGAIGFTWEMPNHLYYKRARANAELLGAPRHQREEIVRLIEGDVGLLAA